MKIFVSIASYKDPELVPTLRDMFAKAYYPHALRVGLCWQYGEGESLQEFTNHSQVAVIAIPATESKGCCWARSLTQTLYDGEHFYLQLDSHHRFEPGWDQTCVKMLGKCPSIQPILTAYLGGYTPGGNSHNNPPWKMVPKHGFTKDGCLLCIPRPWDVPRDAPVPARFLSAHFLFTTGNFVEQVPYDPLLYFTGEEPTLGIRAYTHGFDLYHPNQNIAWHEYTRNGRTRHWDEHNTSSPDSISKARCRKLLGMEENDHNLEGFGLGPYRTLSQYEHFAGIDFKGRRLHQECMDGVDPPTRYHIPEAWAKDRHVWVNWTHSKIEIPEGCTYVAYFVDDVDHKMMWHKVALAKDNFQTDPMIEFTSWRDPAWLVVWPHVGAVPGKKYQMALGGKEVYTV